MRQELRTVKVNSNMLKLKQEVIHLRLMRPKVTAITPPYPSPKPAAVLYISCRSSIALGSNFRFERLSVSSRLPNTVTSSAKSLA